MYLQQANRIVPERTNQQTNKHTHEKLQTHWRPVLTTYGLDRQTHRQTVQQTITIYQPTRLFLS